jgi:hypothetical protein
MQYQICILVLHNQKNLGNFLYKSIMVNKENRSGTMVKATKVVETNLCRYTNSARVAMCNVNKNIERRY